jgi:hypothetical protein
VKFHKRFGNVSQAVRFEAPIQWRRRRQYFLRNTRIAFQLKECIASHPRARQSPYWRFYIIICAEI